MLSMVLVEDETYERVSLREHINWDLIGVSIVGEAANGEQGIAVISAMNPDIVLTDVNMPVMNGIEMSREIRKRYPDIRIVFLSAYDDFDYARNAIDLKIQAYVMKPINETELLLAVKKISDEITRERIEKMKMDSIESQYSEHFDLAKRALINKILIGLPFSPKEAIRLKLGWIADSHQRLVMLLFTYNKDFALQVDENLTELDRNCCVLCEQLISTSTVPGCFIVIFHPYDMDCVTKIEQRVRAFFDQYLPAASVLCDGNITAESIHEFQQQYADYIKEKHEKEKAHTSDDRNKSREQLADKVEQYVYKWYMMPLTIEGIAKDLHYTPNYLSNIYRLVRGTSINKLIMKHRLDKACNQLLLTKDPISDIAIRCGFGSLTYFHTVFKKEKGITPNEFRETGH